MLQPFIVGLAFALHAQWTGHTATALHDRIEALRAKGEPVLVSDFKPKSIDPKDNAKTDLEAAFAAMRKDSNTWDEATCRDDKPNLPLGPAWAGILKRIDAENADALKHLAAARTKPIADVQIEFKTPVVSNLLPGLNKSRDALNLLRFHAWQAASTGKFDEAIATLDQIDTLAAYASSHRMLVAHLVAVGLNAAQAEDLIRLSPSLKIGDAPGDASAALVRKQIDRLMGQLTLQQSFRDALYGERMQLLDAFRAIGKGALQHDLRMAFPMANSATIYWLQPMINENALRSIDHISASIDSAMERDQPAFQARVAEAARGVSVQNSQRRYRLASLLTPSLSRSAHANYRVMTHREAAATALAIRLYQADHANQRPGKLDELVPKYLPRVPRDYLADNKPLGYRAGDPPILWSVGDDGIDSNGREADPAEALTAQEGRIDLVWKLTAGQ